MKDVITFVKNFIDAELKATELSLKPDIDAFNQALDEMDSFLVDSLKSRFGMRHATEPESDSYYTSFKNKKPQAARSLFRIDQIESTQDDTCYAAYLSDVNSDKSYFDCLVVKPLNHSFQIISRFTYGFGRDTKNKKHWYFSGGEKMNSKDLQNIVNSERIRPPEEDAESMKQYLA